MTVVLVHDYLTQRGGAERVALEMMRAFSGSPLFTSVYSPESTFPEFAELPIETSWLQRSHRVRRDPRLGLPALTEVFRRSRVEADVVLVSSSGFAHTIRTTCPKIVYCHNPPRWLHQWDDYRVGLGRAQRVAMGAMRPYLRRADLEGAERASCYLANSVNVASRIRSAYGMEARVLHPPRGLEPDGPQVPVPGLPETFLLTVGRPRGYKRTDLLTDAISGMPDVHLVTVGSTPDPGLPANVHQFVGIPDAQLRWLYAHAAGLLACSIEDFGLTPVEAFGFGTPVATTREGGYLETCEEGVTGMWLDVASTPALRASIREFMAVTWDRDAIRTHGQRWSPPVFREALHRVVDDVLAQTPR